jgi:hypothetical protein
MSRRKPDPIVARESKQRFEAHERAMQDGKQASSACAWFAEYADPSVAASEILDVKPGLVAHATLGAGDALVFVKRAVSEFGEQILERAIELAEAQQRAAEKVRKPPAKRD